MNEELALKMCKAQDTTQVCQLPTTDNQNAGLKNTGLNMMAGICSNEVQRKEQENAGPENEIGKHTMSKPAYHQHYINTANCNRMLHSDKYQQGLFVGRHKHVYRSNTATILTRRPASADRTARHIFQAGLRGDVGL